MGLQTPLYEVSDYLKWTTSRRIQLPAFQRGYKEDERRGSIVNKTPLSAVTNRTGGGAAPSAYLPVIERKAGIDAVQLDDLLRTHLVEAEALRADDFDTHFARRRDALVGLVEAALGKAVQRDVDAGTPQEGLASFDLDSHAVTADPED